MQVVHSVRAQNTKMA